MSEAQIGAGAVVVAGTAMFPDLDTVNSTISRALGPVTYTAARVVGKVSGGHRNGTHSLLGALLTTLIAAWALSQAYADLVKLALCVFFVSLGVRALTESSGAVCFALSAFLGATCATVAPGTEWLVAAVAFGCLLHMFADALTSEGVPLFYPFSRARFKFPVVRQTGNSTEKLIAGACGLVVCVLMTTSVFVPVFNETHRPAPTPEATPVAAAEKRAAPARAQAQACRKLRGTVSGKARTALNRLCPADQAR